MTRRDIAINFYIPEIYNQSPSFYEFIFWELLIAPVWYVCSADNAILSYLFSYGRRVIYFSSINQYMTLHLFRDL